MDENDSYDDEDSRVNLFKLIELIKARPALWNKNNMNHRNKIYLQKIWQYIAREMKLPRSVVQRKWKSLRDRFRLEVKKILAKLRDEPITLEILKQNTSWEYFSDMLFLRKHLVNLPRITDMKSKQQEVVMQKEDVPEALSPQLSESILMDEDTLNESFVNVKTFSDFDEFEDDDDISVGMLNSLTENEVRFEQLDICNGARARIPAKENSAMVTLKSAQMHSDCSSNNSSVNAKLLKYLEKNNSLVEADEDKAFFDSLLPHMRCLEPSHKLLCRMDIQNIVYKFAYGGPVDDTDKY